MLAARLDRLLTLRRATCYAVALALFYVYAWAFFVLGGEPPLSRNQQPIGGDYTAFYTAGRMVLEGNAARLYEAAQVRGLQAEITQNRIPIYNPMQNPPFLALLYAPFAIFGYLSSYAAWSVASLGLLVLAVWLSTDDLAATKRHRARILCLTLGFAPVYLALLAGQNALLSLLLTVLIVRSIVRGDERGAGVWAALGLFKPQLFLVFPIIFLVGRRWRALASYVLVGVVLAVVSVGLVGLGGVLDWVRLITIDEVGIGSIIDYSYRMHSLRPFFGLLLPNMPAVALGLTVVGSILLLVLLVRLWTGSDAWTVDLPLRWAVTSALGLLVNPHLFDYDLAVLLAAGILLGGALPAARWWMVAVCLAAFLRSPIPLGAFGLQTTVVVLMAFVVWGWRKLELGRRGLDPAMTSLSPNRSDAGVVDARVHPAEG